MPGHGFLYAMDPTAAEATLGCKPRYNLETGLAQTLDWHLNNEAWWRPIRDKDDVGKRLGTKR